jgi:hypothetical protein
MDLTLNKGTFFIQNEHETIEFGEGIPFVESIEDYSINENPSRSYSLYNPPSVSFEVLGVDLARLNDFCSIPQSNGKFIINYQHNIMIQARWHKKARIRKKWLKRFGMKPDVVNVTSNATVGEYHTDDGTFDFETDTLPKYLWRPDQMRKGLKIKL